MEALEEKYILHDSFEEVDRILTIVEKSKSEFEGARSRLFFQLIVMVIFTTTSILTLSGTFDVLKRGKPKPEFMNFIDPGFMIGIVALLLTIVIAILSSSYNVYSRNKLYYDSTLKAAAGVIRELVPTLSRLEKWSSLRKFEIKLRLSKLGINSEAMFSERSF